MILEGSLLHYGRPRVLRDDDADLALLLGDQLYALGLSRLAELGDLDAVAELADLISLLAAARAGGRPRWPKRSGGPARPRSGGAPSPEHEAAKALARAGDDGAARALLSASARAPIASAGVRDARLFVDGTLRRAFNTA